MRCPVCNAPDREESTCTRCQTDLLPLLEIYDKARCCYNRALGHAFKQDWNEALFWIEKALAWWGGGAEFHGLKGKILAHRHDYRGACRSWRQAVHLDNHAGSRECLVRLETLLSVMVERKQVLNGTKPAESLK